MPCCFCICSGEPTTALSSSTNASFSLINTSDLNTMIGFIIDSEIFYDKGNAIIYFIMD
jgi:hypothetical protein